MESLKQLVRDPLSEQVARDLEQTVRSGSVASGSRLPSERALAAEFGVNRLVVREALRILGAKGLVATRPGEGTFVLGADPGRDLSSAVVTLLEQDRLDPAVVDELFLMRRFLEMALVKMAAKTASPALLEALGVDLDRFAEGVTANDPGRIAAADESYHRHIAAASGSKVLSRLVEVLWASLANYQQLYFQNCADPGVILDGLAKVTGALRAGSPAAAAKAMEALLEHGDKEFVARMLGHASRRGDAVEGGGVEEEGRSGVRRSPRVGGEA